MKITQIETFRVAVPYIPAIRKYRPTEHTDRPTLLIRMHTDEGIAGWGEGGRAENVDDQIPAWIGRDPLAETLATAPLPFQQALYDIVGQALGVPAHRLMGSLHFPKVPVAYWSCYMAPEDTAREAARAVRLGFTVHKLKARPWDIVEQAERITQAAGPHYEINADPNFTFGGLPQTVRLARQLERYTMQCLEDPFPWANFDQWRLLRERIDIPIAPHLLRAEDALNVLKANAADMMNITGNVATTLAIAALAEAAGLPVWLQTAGLCLGIGAAFSVHLHAVVRNATLPADTLHFLREHDLLVDRPLEPKEGLVTVPQGPGLGVDVDQTVLEQYRVG